MKLKILKNKSFALNYRDFSLVELLVIMLCQFQDAGHSKTLFIKHVHNFEATTKQVLEPIPAQKALYVC